MFVLRPFDALFVCERVPITVFVAAVLQSLNCTIWDTDLLAAMVCGGNFNERSSGRSAAAIKSECVVGRGGGKKQKTNKRSSLREQFAKSIWSVGATGCRKSLGGPIEIDPARPPSCANTPSPRSVGRAASEGSMTVTLRMRASCERARAS